MSNAAIARRALRCLDLTDLTETCSDHSISDLCVKALTPHGPVAAVCVWPQFVSRARDALKGSPVKIATVLNFPAGGEDIDRVTDDLDEALADGANEIDLVMPYDALRRGQIDKAADLVAAVRDVVDQGRVLKVIIETGELKERALIEEASRIAIEAGADFIKTSTGKTPISATPEAAEIMLNAIRQSGVAVGFKAAGGIRTLADAAVYLDLADRIMGREWANPNTFRIGASSLYDALISAIEGRGPAAPGGTY